MRAVGRLRGLGVPAAIVAAFAVWTAVLALNAEGFLEADEVNHFLYAREAPSNPINLLSVWARPLYTAVLVPFAQIGLPASRLLSVLCAAAAATFAALACRALGWRTAGCAAAACYAQPLFFQQTWGIWTEVAFAAGLGAWALALAARRPLWCAAVAAALPLVRPEGFVVALATGIAVLAGALRDASGRPLRLLPLLILPAGVGLWALLGFAASGDPLWLPRHWPSDWAPSSAYGRGDWTWIFGALAAAVPLALLPLVALGCFAPGIGRAWPIVLAMGLVLALHATLWALGAFGSAGYARYLVTLAPAFAILIAGGVEVLARRVEAVPAAAWAVATAGLATLLLLRHPTATFPPPLPPDGVLFAAIGREWIRKLDPRPALWSTHPFAYLEVPSVPADRFEDFPRIRRETLRAAPAGAWLLVEDRFYLRTPDNPSERDLPGLGFERLLGDSDFGLAPAVVDPRHDPAIANMHWALWRKPTR